MEKLKHVALGISGASGVVYGLRLAQCLLEAPARVSLIFSQNAKVIAESECGITLPESPELVKDFLLDSLFLNAQSDNLQVFDEHDWNAPLASGSGAPDSYVICPASMATVADIAHGAAHNLITRAADVVLKLKKPLVLMPRETPFSTLHLKNLLALSEMGAAIFPASPAFYQNPQNIGDLVDFVVARLLDFLNLAPPNLTRWGENANSGDFPR